MKHTPGPWIAKEGMIYSEADNTGKTLAIVTHHSILIEEANATLIAASPELLDACLNIYANMADREELYDEETGEEWNEVRLIREAIDKALPGQGYDKP